MITVNDENTKNDIVALEKERERYITKLFWFALEIAIIFLAPALIAVFILGEYFSKKSLWFILPVTFVLSWVIVIIRWQKINKILTKLDSDIRDLKKQKNHAGNN